MREAAYFQVDEHVTAEKPVVEDKIHEKVLAIESEPALPGLKQKPFSQFQQEMLDPADDSRLQLALAVVMTFLQSQKLQHQRLFENIRRMRHALPFAGQFADALLIPAQSQTLIKAAIELALEIPHCPILRGGLDFIEVALVRVLDAKEKDVMRPAQCERA